MKDKSNLYIVLSEINNANNNDKPIWFNKLYELLNDKFLMKDISRIIDTLTNALLIKCSYGKIYYKNFEYRYYITDLGKLFLRNR